MVKKTFIAVGGTRFAIEQKGNVYFEMDKNRENVQKPVLTAQASKPA